MYNTYLFVTFAYSANKKLDLKKYITLIQIILYNNLI